MTDHWQRPPLKREQMILFPTKLDELELKAASQDSRDDEAKEKYALRSHAGERPFAVIKHNFGARRFLLRGLEQVRLEWAWLATAFNLKRLISLIRSRAGPDASILPID